MLSAWRKLLFSPTTMGGFTLFFLPAIDRFGGSRFCGSEEKGERVIGRSLESRA
jgi:hypothetical protein